MEMLQDEKATKLQSYFIIHGMLETAMATARIKGKQKVSNLSSSQSTEQSSNAQMNDEGKVDGDRVSH